MQPLNPQLMGALVTRSRPDQHFRESGIQRRIFGRPHSASSHSSFPASIVIDVMR